MKIHRFNCSNAANLFTNYGYRILKADWVNQTKRDFTVELKITGIDTGPGVIQTITNEISNNLGVNIKSFSISGDEGIFEGNIKIIVNDKSQLDIVMKQIKKMANISTIERTIM
jgi:GTP pyrophosphokinase